MYKMFHEFADALVHSGCAAGNIDASATTNGNGCFSIILNPLQIVLSLVLNDCQ